jgi:hypothetical protein
VPAVAQQRTTEQTTPPATSTSSAAQTDAPAATSSSATSAKPNDLEITANVTASELRFEVVPEPKVEFTGQPERETVWEADRQNLPRPVQPGVTYRNIGIQLRISSVFADIDRIVAEALGETPITDDTPRDNAAPPASEQPSSTNAAPSNAAPINATPTPRGKP